MPIGLATAIVEAFLKGPEGGDYATMSIAGIDPTSPSDFLLKERAFQYWPETISDTIEIGWSFKDIPGASHALAQWGANGGRTISFDVNLHRFMKPRKSLSIIEKVKTMATVLLTEPNSTIPKNEKPYNVDIAAEVRFLRGFCYPYFELKDGLTISRPPPVAILSIPGVPLDDKDGSSTCYAVMTGCDVTYTLLFPDGTPRRATVSLTFRQIVQYAGQGVFFRGHPNDYDFGPGEENLAPGGLGSPNNIKIKDGNEG